MDLSKLFDNNIFVIPVGHHWQIEDERLFLIYSPLNGHISLSGREGVERLSRCAEGIVDDEVQKKILNTFQAKGSVPVMHMPDCSDDLYLIDILPNYTCNFNCVYCYSAAGRSNRQIDFEDIRKLVDYLFNSEKKQKNPYIINFSGGGEPLLSFPIIRKTIEYIKSSNKGKAYKYSIGLVTNGSLITPEIIDYFQKEQIDMAVSFEILERFQNAERGSYERVAANIDMMLAKGYPFGIRTTFTPDSVSSMTEMVQEVARRFPKLKTMVYDTVLAPAMFPTPQSLQNYYNAFLENFYKAKEEAKKYGINLESNAVETLSVIRDRTCQGKIVLTPEGTISCCARVSSPQERLYNEYVFGETTHNGISFDEQHLDKIMSEYNIFSQEKCHSCFAKLNCGGGCRLFHHGFSPQFDDIRCDFAKKALQIELLSLLSRQFFQSTGKNLNSYVNEKIASGSI